MCREKSQGRLGTLDLPRTNVRDGVPYPIRLDIPGVRVVSLIAGGTYVVSLMIHVGRERLATLHKGVGSSCTGPLGLGARDCTWVIWWFLRLLNM